jgi:hypothetical protein
MDGWIRDWRLEIAARKKRNTLPFLGVKEVTKLFVK